MCKELGQHDPMQIGEQFLDTDQQSDAFFKRHSFKFFDRRCTVKREHTAAVTSERSHQRTASKLCTYILAVGGGLEIILPVLLLTLLILLI